MRSLDDLAYKAKDKKAAIGPDIDLDTYSIESPLHADVKNLDTIPKEDREKMTLAGLDASEKERAGTYVQRDATAVHSGSNVDGLEIIPIRKALEEIDWIRDYYWKLASVGHGQIYGACSSRFAGWLCYKGASRQKDNTSGAGMPLS